MTSNRNDHDEKIAREPSILSISQLGQKISTVGAPTAPGALITLTWIDITYTFKPPRPSLLRRIFQPSKFKAWKAMEGLRILDGVLGEIRPGEMIGIMGGSGAGKTTMLNILAGKVVGGDPDGTININGLPRDPVVWPFILSYVEQEDILDENLTVREMIRFAVDMRNPEGPGCDKVFRAGKTLKLMKAMGLESVGDRKIGVAGSGSGITGGERKRLSIAIELAAERRVVFLDESTTGLDAATSLSLLQTISELASLHQLSVIMSIHQPSGKALSKLTKILLLSLGRTVYFGSLSEITSHFNSLGFKCPRQENPADWIMDVISVDNSGGGRFRADSKRRIEMLHKEWEQIEREHTTGFERRSRSFNGGSNGKGSFRSSIRSAFSSSNASAKSVETGNGSISSTAAEKNQRRSRTRSVTSLFLRPRDDAKPRTIGYRLGWLPEFGLLIRRYTTIEMRNHRSNIVLFSEFFLLSLILGFVFFRLTTENFGGFQSRVGLFATIPALIIGLISVDLMILFTRKRRLIIRERFSHLYRLRNAYTANVLAIIPVRIVSVTVFATIMYYLIGLRTDSFTYFLIYLGIILLVTLFSVLFGIMVAAASTGSLMASVLRMIFIYIFILFGGNLARSSDITPIISWMRFLSPYFYCLQALLQNECIGLTIAGEPGVTFVDLYDLNQFSIMWNAGALMIMCGATFIIGYLGLSYTTKPKYIVI